IGWLEELARVAWMPQRRTPKPTLSGSVAGGFPRGMQRFLSQPEHLREPTLRALAGAARPPLSRGHALPTPRRVLLTPAMAKPGTEAAREEATLRGARVLVVGARFYDEIADMLLQGAMRELDKAGAAFDRISVPGSLEIPPAIAIALEAAERQGK